METFKQKLRENIGNCLDSETSLRYYLWIKPEKSQAIA